MGRKRAVEVVGTFGKGPVLKLALLMTTQNEHTDTLNCKAPFSKMKFTPGGVCLSAGLAGGHAASGASQPKHLAAAIHFMVDIDEN